MDKKQGKVRGDIKDFLIHTHNPNEAIRKVCQSSIREIISDSSISDVLSNKKQEIGNKMQQLIQRLSDQYMIGVDIEKVQLLAVEPPAEVVSAYRDVQSSRADKENKISEANAYRNTVVTEAIGESNKAIRAAEAYKYSVTSRAEGDIKQFNALLDAYQDQKVITKHRLSVDMLSKVLSGNNKIILDSSNPVLAHIPLPEILKNNKSTK